MKLTIHHGHPLQGIVHSDIPGDKSISHRSALLAAIAHGESHIENFQVSGVTQPMLQALKQLGVAWQLNGTTLQVQGKGLYSLKNPAAPIDCGNSATTLRILTGLLAAAGVSTELTGTPALCRRPMGRIVDPLHQMGVQIDSSPAGTAPLRLSKRASNVPLLPLNYTLPVASAQVKSCLLLAALGATGKTRLVEPGPSRDHTERMLESMGVKVQSSREVVDIQTQYVVEITPPDPSNLRPLNMCIPGDPSAAAFLIVAALITPGSHLILQKVCLNPTRTGLIDVLQSMGADISIQNQTVLSGEPVGDLEINYSQLHAATISGELVVRMIDEFPIFAIAALRAAGKSIVQDAAELRLKESDRITMLAGELRKLGIKVEEQPDGFAIEGGTIHGGRVQSHGDHRLSMSLIVAGLAAESTITVQDADCFTESFPSFVQVLTNLGANIEVEE